MLPRVVGLTEYLAISGVSGTSDASGVSGASDVSGVSGISGAWGRPIRACQAYQTYQAYQTVSGALGISQYQLALATGKEFRTAKKNKLLRGSVD